MFLQKKNDDKKIQWNDKIWMMVQNNIKSGKSDKNGGQAKAGRWKEDSNDKKEWWKVEWWKEEQNDKRKNDGKKNSGKTKEE